tara:strand:+ start:295 stop:399 length:105 start_codon:yes stop_codon:yes gene_type:complete
MVKQQKISKTKNKRENNGNIVLGGNFNNNQREQS